MPFSHRTDWPTSINPLTAAIQRLRSTNTPLVDLTRTNPTACGLSPDLSDGPVPNQYDPNPLGAWTTREAIARYLNERNGTITPDHIWLTSGTSEAYAQLMHMLCNPGDAWCVPSPGYPLFDFIAKGADVQLVSYPLTFDHGWHLNLDALNQLLNATPRARAVVVVSPHNPTGHVWTNADRQRVQELCLANNVALIVDEVFLDYAHSPGNRLSTAAQPSSALTFVLSGLSKVTATPQLKVAWGAVTGPDAVVTEALRRLEWINDTYLSVGTYGCLQAPNLLAQAGVIQERILSRCRNNLQTAKELLTDTPGSVLEPAAGWALCLRFPAVCDDETWALKLLDEQKVIIQPGHWYRLDTALSAPHGVVSLLTAPDLFREGMERVATALRGP